MKPTKHDYEGGYPALCRWQCLTVLPVNGFGRVCVGNTGSVNSSAVIHLMLDVGLTDWLLQLQKQFWQAACIVEAAGTACSAFQYY
jgi:hypothetical protein